MLQVFAALWIIDQLERLIRLALVVGRESICLVGRDGKRSIGHTERLKNVFCEVLIQRLT